VALVDEAVRALSSLAPDGAAAPAAAPGPPPSKKPRVSADAAGAASAAAASAEAAGADGGWRVCEAFPPWPLGLLPGTVAAPLTQLVEIAAPPSV